MRNVDQITALRPELDHRSFLCRSILCLNWSNYWPKHFSWANSSHGSGRHAAS